MGCEEVEVLNVDVLHAMRSIRSFNMPIENAALGLKFKAISTAFFRDTQA